MLERDSFSLASEEGTMRAQTGDEVVAGKSSDVTEAIAAGSGHL